MENKLICSLCSEELVESKTTFSYMKYTFYADLPRCPVCGQVYIDEELVKGRIAEVEMELEDK